MSLPAMLVGETIGEILTASKFAREMVQAVTKNTIMDDPKTPLTQHRNRRPNLEDSDLRARRKREKRENQPSKRIESHSPSLQRVRSRINFKVVSPPTKRDVVVDKENARYMANRVSPRNKPWTKKTILFPNPLFLSSDTSQQPKFCRTNSPVITKTRQQTPHKFLIKSSPVSASKFQVKIRSPPMVITRSPTRPVVIRSPTNKQTPKRLVVITRSPTKQVNSSKQSPKRFSAASKLRRSFSPSRLVPAKMRQSFSPARMTASKLRQSFSPSRLAARLVSPLKSRKSVQKIDGHINMSGLKHATNLKMRI